MADSIETDNAKAASLAAALAPALAPALATLYAEPQSLGYSYAPDAASYGDNIQPAWLHETGAGIGVAVIDDGFTPATIQNWSAQSASFSADGTTAEPAGASHGTTTSSLIGGAPLSGMTGLAPDATILGVKVPFGDTQVSTFAAALAYAASGADVINNSWGFSGFAVGEPADPAFAGWNAALQQAVAEGRGGLGAIVVFAAGNARAAGADLGLAPFTADPRAIAVAASTPAGTVAPFSTPGAGLWVSAVGTNILLASPTGLQIGSGTSYAAPIVSSTAALMLQADPALGWRDVQEILADSAYAPAPAAAGFVTNAGAGWNGGGMHFSNDLGFGVVDANVAVNLARSWTIQSTSADLATVTAGATGPTLDFTTPERIEHVQVSLTGTNLPAAGTTLTLTSPAGTTVTLAATIGLVGGPGGGVDATGGLGLSGDEFAANAFLSENAAGTWALSAAEADGTTATITGWSLTVWGDAGAGSQPLVYTPEFAALAAADPARAVVSNAGLGTQTIDIVATPGTNDIDLAGGTGLIDGVPVSVRPGLANLSFAGDTGLSLARAAPAGSTIIGGDAMTGLIGGGGADSVTAGLGFTTMLQNGDAKLTFLAGPGGSEITAGGAGTLAYTGGAGADELLLNFGQEGGTDILQDFAVGQDRIVLHGYGAGILGQLLAAQRTDGAGGTLLTLPDHTRIDLVGMPYAGAGLFAST